MSAPKARTVRIADEDVRIWEKGRGTPVVVLAGWGGLTRWTEFLESLSASRRVIAPSLPGFPGSGRTHEKLDSHMDWLIAVHDLVAAAGTRPVDLVGISVGGALAADVAALWPGLVRRLVLVSPLGLYDPGDPLPDLFAQPPGGLESMLTADPDVYKRHIAQPEGADELEWQITVLRANEAAARLLWPLGDTGLAKRLHRIGAPALIVVGDQDKVVPRSYPQKFAAAIGGKARVKTIPRAGHLVDLDAPDALAKTVLAHLGGAGAAARPKAKKRAPPRRTPARKRR